MQEGAPAAGKVQDWLRLRAPWEGAEVRSVAVLDGGASNITCRVSLEHAPQPDVVLRLQRKRGIFEPYDVLKEGEVLRRLAASEVPVPGILGQEPDPDYLGAPFIVMEWVDAPHMGVAGPEASYAAFTAMVATIHRQDWRALDLGFLGVPADAAAALRGELEAIARREALFVGEREPLLAQARTRLAATVPADGRLALCQGDINVFNYLFRAQRVVAVVDWEQARISDPRSDVGQLMALSHLKGASLGPAAEQPFVQAYGAASGTALAGMEWFRARWLWELGVIYYGWKAFNDSDPWYTWDDLARLLRLSLEEL